MKKSALALILCLPLAACSASDFRAVMQHPETKHTVECKVTDDDIFIPDPLGTCVKNYEKAGYKRIDLPADPPE